MPQPGSGLCERKLGFRTPACNPLRFNIQHGGRALQRPQTCPLRAPPPKGRGQGGAKARTRAQSGRAQARSPGDVGARVLARSRLAGAPRVSVPRVDCAGASLQDGGGGSWPSEAGGFGSVAPEPAPAGPGAVSSGPALSQESKVGRGGGRGPH